LGENLIIPTRAVVDVQLRGGPELILDEERIGGDGEQGGRLSEGLQIVFKGAGSQVRQTCEMKISGGAVDEIVAVVIDVDVDSSFNGVAADDVSEIVGEFITAVGG
jgi:hypothetical protein